METAVVNPAEDDGLPSTQPLNDDILKGVVAYVDVRSGHDNRTRGISLQLEEMGATVSKRFNKTVTHVVFNEGSKATFEKARRLNLHLLSALWVHGCKKNGVRVSENFYPAIVSDAYHSKIVKLRKLKSMQPTDLAEAYERSERVLKRRKRREQRKKFEEVYASTDGLLNNVIDYTDEYDPNEDFYKIDLPDFRSAPTGLVLCDSTTDDDDDSDEENEKIPNLARRLFNKMPDSPILQEAFARGLKFRRSKVLDTSALAAARGLNTSAACSNTSSLTAEVADTPNASHLGVSPISGLRALSLESRQPVDTATAAAGCESEDLFGPSIVMDGGGRTPQQPMPAGIDLSSKMEISLIEESSFAAPNATPRAEASAFDRLLALPDSCRQRSSTPRRARDNVALTTPRITRRSMALPQTPLKVEDDIFDRGGDSEDPMSPPLHRSEVTARRTAATTTSKLVPVDDIGGATGTNTGIDAPVSPILVADTVTQPNFEAVRELKRPAADSASCRQLGGSTRKSSMTQSKLSFLPSSSVSKGAEAFRKGSVKRKRPVVTPLKPQSTCLASHLTPQCNSLLSPATAGSSVKQNRQRRSMDDFQLDAKKPKRLQSTLLGFCKAAIPFNAAPNTRHLVLTSFEISEKEVLVPIVCKLGGVRIGQKVDGRTTHVICGDDRRTLNVLMGTVKGCWLLNSHWIYKSLEAGEWLPEEPYELSVAFPSARTFRMERSLDTGFGYRCRLFQSVPERIYVHPHTAMPHQDLELLLQLAGANVTRTVRDAKLVIGSFVRGCDAPCLPEKWILDSISRNQVLPRDDYLMSSLSPAYS